eukprot:gnl/TRDRNA2_/TRDRNA2_87719_c0_seq1.p1 gnl/TRDRNA2_/TRDRNA2_87719_c0~~gnl/TRDRNA2_/TRDRNA2_87719_c0_seq1.p1  ORF type:complete len:137 (-),score=21.38 gnl/TRDRNA2_/TRDRNA2_87719_c0_seq1:308-718(-)
MAVEVEFNVNYSKGGVGGPLKTEDVTVAVAAKVECSRALKENWAEKAGCRTEELSAEAFERTYLSRASKALGQQPENAERLRKLLRSNKLPLVCTVLQKDDSHQMGYNKSLLVEAQVVGHIVNLSFTDSFDFYSMK